jgi:hypothetical protein
MKKLDFKLFIEMFGMFSYIVPNSSFRKHIESTLQNELNLNYIYVDPKTTDLIYVGFKK